MAPAKKQKISKDRSFKDFLLVLETLSKDYQAVGCHCKAQDLNGEIFALQLYAWQRKCSHQPLTDTKRFENSGVGSNILDMMDEFIKTGKCEVRDELLSVKQVPLVSPALSLGVFRQIGKWDTGFYLFLYETEDEDKRPLYADFSKYHGTVWNHCLEKCHGLDRLQEEYEHLERFEFVRKTTPDEREDAKTSAGDADICLSLNRRWQSGEDGITRDELRDLVRSGKYELKYHDALEELHREEKNFLEKAEFGLQEAINCCFPYEDVTWQHDTGFDLLVTRE